MSESPRIGIVASIEDYVRLMNYQQNLPRPDSINHIYPEQIELLSEIPYTILVVTPDLLTLTLRWANLALRHLIVLAGTDFAYKSLTEEQYQLLIKYAADPLFKFHASAEIRARNSQD